jgi:hypothetical protein
MAGHDALGLEGRGHLRNEVQQREVLLVVLVSKKLSCRQEIPPPTKIGLSFSRGQF